MSKKIYSYYPGQHHNLKELEREVIIETEFHWTVCPAHCPSPYCIGKNKDGWYESKEQALEHYKEKILKVNLDYHKMMTERTVALLTQVEDIQRKS